MKVFGLAGYSGAGKTTLIKTLLPALINRDITVSTIKHAHHNFDVDTPGKDSHTHRISGAKEVLVSGGKRWALLHELREEKEPSLDLLIQKITPVDLLLVEGFKHDKHPKLEIYRVENEKDRLINTIPNVVALATNGEHDNTVPSFNLNDVEAIADFIVRYNGLENKA